MAILATIRLCVLVDAGSGGACRADGGNRGRISVGGALAWDGVPFIGLGRWSLTFRHSGNLYSTSLVDQYSDGAIAGGAHRLQRARDVGLTKRRGRSAHAPT